VTAKNAQVAHMNMATDAKPYLVVDQLRVLRIQDHIDVPMPMLAYSLSMSRDAT
jgi:hypothetical protein